VKLTEETTAQIRASGESSRALAPRFGVSASRIREIRQGEEGATKKREQKRLWRRAGNPEARAADREATARWSAANQGRRRAHVRKWRRANPAKVATFNAGRRALRRGAAVGRPKETLAVYALAKSSAPVSCAYCGKQTGRGERHVDHLVPLSRGGAHSAENLCVCCAACNLAKGTRTDTEFLGDRSAQ
jgi:5-methylcytosine-specific restriction endonuclease McrA